MDLDGLRIETEALVLVGKEILDLGTLIALELNHVAHLGVLIANDGAIAGCKQG